MRFWQLWHYAWHDEDDERNPHGNPKHNHYGNPKHNPYGNLIHNIKITD